LISEMNARIQRACRKAAEDAGRDCVVGHRDIKNDNGLEVVDLTDEVIAKLDAGAPPSQAASRPVTGPVARRAHGAGRTYGPQPRSSAVSMPEAASEPGRALMPMRCAALALAWLAACTTAPPGRELQPPRPTTRVATFDPSGRPTAAVPLADQVWGIGAA